MNEIKSAWQAFAKIVGNPKMVFGGASTMLTTNFGDAGNPLLDIARLMHGRRDVGPDDME